MSTSKQYDSHAEQYDEQSRVAAPWLYMDVPLIEKDFIPLLGSGAKVLEIGCGGGKVMELLRDHGTKEADLVGLDGNASLLTIAKKHLPKAKFILEDATTTSPNTRENAFDAIISVRVFDYFTPDNLHQAMKNAYRALKPGGPLYMIVGHPLRVNDGDLSEYLKRGPRTVYLPWGKTVDLEHKTVGDYMNACVNAGFKIIKVDELLMPERLKDENPEMYAKYASYGATLMTVLLRK